MAGTPTAFSKLLHRPQTPPPDLKVFHVKMSPSQPSPPKTQPEVIVCSELDLGAPSVPKALSPAEKYPMLIWKAPEVPDGMLY